ncbi:MAG: hypothetical protein SAMD01599839_08070 [Rectinema sp.]
MEHSMNDHGKASRPSFGDNPYLGPKWTVNKLLAAREDIIRDEGNYSSYGKYKPEARRNLLLIGQALGMLDDDKIKQGRIRVSERSDRTYGGVTFDSKAEMTRYCELLMLKAAGAISDLVLQPVFILQEPFHHETFGDIEGVAYVADFQYFDIELGHKVVEDVKGMITDVYALKKRLFLARYSDIDFREVGMGGAAGRKRGKKDHPYTKR